MSDLRSRIPSVDRLLAQPHGTELTRDHGHALVVRALRRAVQEVRDEFAGGEAVPSDVADPDRYLDRAGELLAADRIPSLRLVINATGVVLHTNLGRAPLAEEAVEAMERVSRGYSNLEYDLEGGRRGSRYVHCVSLLRELTGAEDALVVNNAAAGLMLALNTLALGQGVAVSRGELVEIGGGFRIPEILERSGARLREVGSTNRTRLGDYRTALDVGVVGAVLKVHRSNFRITGFTEEAPVDDLVELAHAAGVPLVYDLGSGLLADPAALGLPPEPRPRDAVAAGADLVVFSGDKLLGGPQAGVIVGRGEVVARLRRNPMCRALRLDKVALAGLEATLRLYRRPEKCVERIPVLAMLAARSEALERRARAMAAKLGEGGAPCIVVETRGAVGGGTYPGVELPSWALTPDDWGDAEALARGLRNGDPPVIGRVLEDRVLLDLRTVIERDECLLVRRLVEECQRGGSVA